MILEEIADISSLESISLEMKIRLDKNDSMGWLKTVAGFANAEGGDLYIGVEDKTNKLVGFERRDADNERNFFNNEVNEHIVPRPETKITFIPYENNGRTLYIMKIRVDESPVKPITVKFKGVMGIYMRRDGYTNGATLEEIVSMSTKTGKVQFDQLDTDEVYSRNDFSRLIEFHKRYAEGKDLPDRELESMSFFNEEGKLKKGALLFRDDYSDAKTTVKCSLFSGTTRGSDRLVTLQEFRGNLSDSIGFMMEFVKARMNHSIIKLPQGRKNIDAYPERALFEGIVNAVAHRDYYIDGSQIQIDMFRDRLEITSPGSYYKGIRIQKTFNLDRFISKRRNELITNVLVSCSVMEAAGTGFEKIIQSYEGQDSAHRPFIYSTSDHFRLVLPDLTYEEGIADSDDMSTVELIPIERISSHDEKILKYCAFKACKSSEIAAFLGINDSYYFRKNILEKLCEKEYLHIASTKNPKLYRTSEDIIIRENS